MKLTQGHTVSETIEMLNLVIVMDWIGEGSIKLLERDGQSDWEFQRIYTLRLHSFSTVMEID